MEIEKREFLIRQLEMRRAMRNGDCKWEEIKQFREESGMPPVHIDTLRKGAWLLDEYDEAGFVKAPDLGLSSKSSIGETISINAKNEVTSDKRLQLDSDRIKDSDYLMQAHGFDPNEFDLVNAKSSFWGKEGTRDFYSSRIAVKPKINGFNLKALDDYFENKDFVYHKPRREPMQYDPNGEFLEIDVPDLHIGLKANKNETLEHYDIDEARCRFINSINDIKYRCEGKKFSKIYLVPLGDWLHFDNAQQSTTKGTPQSTAVSFSEMFQSAVDILIEGIDILADIAPVKLMYIAGNHDKVLGYSAMVAIQKAYRFDDNVEVDISPLSRKIIKEGNVLIGLLHGDMNKDRMAEWIQSDYRKEFGESKFVEIHSGHLHHQQVIEKNGVIVRHLPTLCSSSSWEYEQGYGKSVKTLISFVWNKQTGLRETWYSGV